MTLDTLNTAARAAGYALAGEPLADMAEADKSRQLALQLPRPAEPATKTIDTAGWKDWFAIRMSRASA
jgi:hypothetical protein